MELLFIDGYNGASYVPAKLFNNKEKASTKYQKWRFFSMACAYNIDCMLDCFFKDTQGNKIPCCDGYYEDEEKKKKEEE